MLHVSVLVLFSLYLSSPPKQTSKHFVKKLIICMILLKLKYKKVTICYQGCDRGIGPNETRVKMMSFNITFILELLCSFSVFWRWGRLWYSQVVILSKGKIEESLMWNELWINSDCIVNKRPLLLLRWTFWLDRSKSTRLTNIFNMLLFYKGVPVISASEPACTGTPYWNGAILMLFSPVFDKSKCLQWEKVYSVAFG